MSSLQIIVRLGPKRWSGLSSLLRASTELSQNSLPPRHDILSSSLACTTCSFYSSDGDKKVKSTQQTQTNCLQTADVAKPTAGSDAASIKNEDLFDEIMEKVQKPYSTGYIRDCEWRLYEWSKQMILLRKAGKPVNLNKIVSGQFSKVVEFTLTPQSPPYLRQKCISLLLSEETDKKLLADVLDKTLVDAMHLPINVITDIISTLSTSTETALRKQTRVGLVTVIVNRRWYEISAKHAVFFMYQLDELFDMKSISHQLRQKDKEADNSADSQKTEIFEEAEEHSSLESRKGESQDVPVLSVNLETRLINLTDELKVKDLARVVILLAKWRNRNETLLNAVIHRLKQADLADFNFVQLNNLLFACSVLSIYNDDFLRKLSGALSQSIPTSASLACAVLGSFSHLRWKDTDVIHKYLHYLGQNVSQLKAKDAHNVLLSLGNLHAKPEGDAEVILINELVDKVLSGDVPASVRVTCTWSLAILQCLNSEIAAAALQPQFVQQFTNSRDFQDKANLQKLCNISSTVKLEVNNYSGPYIEEEIRMQTEASSLCSDKDLTSSLVNALKKFADLSTYTSLSERSDEGIVIDAVMCANSEGEVRPLAQLKEGDSKGGLHRLAIQLIPFSGVICPCNTAAGSYQLTARHLQHLGYIPVQILYSDLKASQSVLEHINNIKAKIKEAVANRLTHK